jgi:hypothetical protein
MTLALSAPVDPVAAFLARHADDPDTFVCTCGQERKIGEKCSTPERCAILFARATCVCSLPGATRKECGGARNLKTPCRCRCHTRLPGDKEAERLFFWVVRFTTGYQGESRNAPVARQRDARRLSRQAAAGIAWEWNLNHPGSARYVRVRRRRPRSLARLPIVLPVPGS